MAAVTDPPAESPIRPLPPSLAPAAMVVAVRPKVPLRRKVPELRLVAPVWLPAPFLPEDALRAGIVHTTRALVAGGWVMVAHGKFGANAIDDAVARFKTVAFGGTALDDQQAQDLLRQAGLTDVFTAPTPQGAPAITCGRRASV